MRSYVYCWRMSSRNGIDVEILVTAQSAPEARRRVDSWLAERRPLLERGVERTAAALVGRSDAASRPDGGSVPVVAAPRSLTAKP
jgi:hypothetical protein